jgi:hypothetical protein
MISENEGYPPQFSPVSSYGMVIAGCGNLYIDFYLIIFKSQVKFYLLSLTPP